MLRESLTEKAVLGVVSALNHIIFVLECVDEHDRTKNLLLVDLRFFIDVLEDRWLDKIALASSISILASRMSKHYIKRILCRSPSHRCHR